jgi:hypothetical protein
VGRGKVRGVKGRVVEYAYAGRLMGLEEKLLCKCGGEINELKITEDSKSTSGGRRGRGKRNFQCQIVRRENEVQAGPEEVD